MFAIVPILQSVFLETRPIPEFSLARCLEKASSEVERVISVNPTMRGSQMVSENMKISENLSEHEFCLAIEGDLSVDQAKILQDTFARALEDSRHVSIDFSGVRNISVACMQIVCAACRQAVEMKNTLVWKRISQSMLQTVVETGFFRRQENQCAKSQLCPWTVNKGE